MKQVFLYGIALLITCSVAGQSVKFGEIRNEATAEPVQGATIVFKDSTSAMTTDVNGKFTFQQREKKTILITAVVFKEKEYPIGTTDHYVILL